MELMIWYHGSMFKTWQTHENRPPVEIKVSENKIELGDVWAHGESYLWFDLTPEETEQVIAALRGADKDGT